SYVFERSGGVDGGIRSKAKRLGPRVRGDDERWRVTGKLVGSLQDDAGAFAVPGARGVLFELCAQAEFLDLVVEGARELGAELEEARDHVVGHVAAAVLDEVGLAEERGALEDDRRRDFLLAA